MAKYIYKGREISHIQFLSIMRASGICSAKVSAFETLKNLAGKGHKKATEILDNLQIKD